MPEKTGHTRNKLTPQELRNLDLEIAFMEGLVKRDPSHVEALLVLGDNYTRRGRFQEGLQIDLRLARLRPDDATVHYNLACSYSLTSQLDSAFEALNKAINLGFHDFEAIAKDPDLKELREHAGYKKIRAKVRRLRVKQT
jgi:tetratricopeptide (TPR) repeat protein